MAKTKVLYALKGIERDQILSMQRQMEMLQTSQFAILNLIRQREQVPETPDVIFDLKTLTFQRKPSQD